MGLTIAEKLISSRLENGTLKKGERISIKINQTITHDVTGVMVYLEFEAMGIPRVKTDLSISYVDHNLIQADFKNPDDHQFLKDTAAKFGVIYSRPGNGVLHQLHMERFAIPGTSMLGADSHTVAAGGMGVLAIGSGGLDVAMAMAGEPFTITMPDIVKVHLSGQLRPWISAKNVILEILRRVSVKGGVGKIFEYSGPGVGTLSVPERCIIADMGAETGATTSIFPSDDVTRDWMRAQGREKLWVPVSADEDACYDKIMHIDLSSLQPLISLPHQPDRVVPVSEVTGKPIDQVLFGSCTNSSLQDILTIAHILKDNRVHDNVDSAINYGSRQVLLESLARGAHQELVRSGVRILETFCGGCNGSGFAPPTNGVSLRTHPRNFLGRCGTEKSDVYLVSPEVAAASAITGVITDPRKIDKAPFVFATPEKFIVDDSMFIHPQRDGLTMEIRRGPNIKPLPSLDPLPEALTGTTLLKLEDDITTDHIVPAGANFLPIRSNIPELSKHAFRVVDSTFPARALAAGGGFIVAGANYGQGSSREQAALCPRYLGVKAIIAKSFARIHFANLINFGLLPVTFENEDDYARIEQGDELYISISGLQEGNRLIAKNLTQGRDFFLKNSLSKTDIEILQKGGRLNWIKERNKNSAI